MPAKATPFIARLEALVPLSTSDKDALLAAASNVRTFPARTDLARAGDKATHVHVLLDGFACRYKLIESGKRQIVAYLVPGDVSDSHASVLEIMDDSILSIAESRIALIARDTLRTLLDRHPAVLRAFSCSTLVNNSILRTWLANIGRRSPETRIAHFFCEMQLRLCAVGLADGNKFHFPITQADLGDTMGLSTVHTNRTLQMLKKKNLVATKRGVSEIVDLRRLQDFCHFDPSYLHIGGDRELPVV